MEYADGGDMKSLINKQIMNNNEKLSEELLWDYSYQIASALKYLHNKKIIHRDIKSENVFITADKYLKLADFGISKVLSNTLDFAKSGVGTPFYLSPEICKGDNYNFKTDIWMFGCLMYELSTLKKPFKANSFNLLIDKIVNYDPDEIEHGYSNDLKSLILSMLRKSPEERPGIDEILQKIQKNSKLYKKQTSNLLFIPKTIDKNKLKIEIYNESFENSPQVSQKITPNSNNSLPTGLKLNSKLFAGDYVRQKFTPSSQKSEVEKIMKKMKLSPMKTNTPSNSQNGEEKVIRVRKTSTTTANSTPTNVELEDLIKSEFKVNKTEVKLKKGHFRHISLNISSVQSSDHDAVYHLDTIEKIENIEFAYPSNNTADNTKSNKFNKQTLTPTNCLNVNSKIVPKESIMKNLREIPKSTKVHFEQDTNLVRKTLIRNFLIERYTKEKFSLMYDSIMENNKVIDPQKIKLIVGDDYNIAINYLGNLINTNNTKFK